MTHPFMPSMSNPSMLIGPTFWWCIKAASAQCDFRRPGTEKGFTEVTAHEREVHGVEYVEVPVEERGRNWANDFKDLAADIADAEPVGLMQTANPGSTTEAVFNQDKFADYLVKAPYQPITKFPGTQRESILNEAREYVTKDRAAQHGQPENNFANIARFWDAWLRHRLKDGEHITDVDVAEMMSLLKKGRKMSNPDNRDNYADEIGYDACAWELHHRQELAEGQL